MAFVVYYTGSSRASVLSREVDRAGGGARCLARRRSFGFPVWTLLPTGTRAGRWIMDAQYQRHFWYQERMNELGKRRKSQGSSFAVQSCQADGERFGETSELPVSNASCAEDASEVKQTTGGESLRAARSDVLRGAASMHPKADQKSSITTTEEGTTPLEEQERLSSANLEATLPPDTRSDIDVDDDGSGEMTTTRRRLDEKAFSVESSEEPRVTESVHLLGRKKTTTDEVLGVTDRRSADATVSDSETKLDIVSASVPNSDPRHARAANASQNESVSENTLERPRDSSRSQQVENQTGMRMNLEPTTTCAPTDPVSAAESTDHRAADETKADPNPPADTTPETISMPSLRWPVAKPRRIAEILRVPGTRAVEKPTVPKPAQVTSVDLGRQRLDIVYAIRRGWRPGKTDSDAETVSPDSLPTADDPDRAVLQGSNADASATPDLFLNESSQGGDNDDADPAQMSAQRSSKVVAPWRMGITDQSKQLVLRFRGWFLRLAQIFLAMLGIFRQLGRNGRKPRI
jgi:hypothetical protein